MKIIDFGQFSFEKYSVSNVSVIKQRNNWSYIHSAEGRIYNGFLVITEGECVYRWDETEITLSPGSVIYLPKGSRHTVTAPLRSLEFFRVNFTVTDIRSSEETVFSDMPVFITHSAPQRITDICSELCALTLRPRTDFKTMAPLSEFIDFCMRALNSTAKGIDVAVEYIADHCVEEISIGDLADMCFMSGSHFFRTFKQKFGMTPIEYKNSLRIKKAKKLLRDPDCSVGEIAELLGYEGACYFSRAFKRETGLSPLAYRKERTGK